MSGLPVAGSGDQRRQARRTVADSSLSPRTARTRRQVELWRRLALVGRLDHARCDQRDQIRATEQDPPAPPTQGSRHDARHPIQAAREPARKKRRWATTAAARYRREGSGGSSSAVGVGAIAGAARRMTVTRPPSAVTGGPNPRRPGFAAFQASNFVSCSSVRISRRAPRDRRATPRCRRRADGSRSRSHRPSRRRAKSSRAPSSSARAGHGSSRRSGRSASKWDLCACSPRFALLVAQAEELGHVSPSLVSAPVHAARAVRRLRDRDRRRRGQQGRHGEARRGSSSCFSSLLSPCCRGVARESRTS